MSLEALSDTACSLIRHFLPSCRAPKPLTHHSWLAVRARTGCHGGQPDTTYGTCRAQKLWSPAQKLLHHHQAKYTVQSTGWRTLQRKPNLELSSPCPSFLCTYQTPKPCLSWGVSPGNLGVWTRATGAPPQAMEEGNKSPNPRQFLCQLDVLHV